MAHTNPYTRRLALTLLCAPLVLLAGCPADPLADQTAAIAQPANATAPTLTQQSGAQQARAVMPGMDPAAQQQKAQALINHVDQSYRSGVENYRANRLDAARLDFDFAVDMMLTSGMDLKNDPQLSESFERLVDAINSLELAALKQGNGLSPKLEAAPLESADDITFPSNPELTAKLKAELNLSSDLPLVINDQVAGYINVFAQSNSFRNHMGASLQRVGKYRGLIQSVLRDEGVPQDLIYLAVAESGFQPQALNARSGAGGMWQFMPATGVNYGLQRNGYFDDRFDPEKSSRAYAKYIKALYDQFGDWYLAMAAYNWGPGNIQKVVQRTGYADFWELYRRGMMPAETRAYVPQILAAVIMAKNPEKYGLDKLTPSPPVIYDKITTSYSIDLRLVSDVTGASMAELVALNPSMLRLATPRDMSFDLHIPAGTKPLYDERLKDIPEDRRVSWRFHVVKPGETVDEIATSLHARVADITSTNGITSNDPMSAGDELVVPVQSVTAAVRPQRYTVGRGDTLVTVADRFNVSVEELRRWNNLTSNTMKPGRSLYVAEPVKLGPTTRLRARTRNGGGHSSRGASRGSSHGSSRGTSAQSRANKGSASSTPAKKKKKR